VDGNVRSVFFFPVDTMKHFLATITLLLLFCHLTARAESVRLDVGHFDPQAGLTITQTNAQPLPDGCLGQVIEDTDDNGIAPPAQDGTPGSGDALLRNDNSARTDAGGEFIFVVNGGTQLTMPGCFLIEPGFALATAPQHRVFVRVWNAPSPDQATGYWDSPLYAVLPGVQQISFARTEWCFNAFTPVTHGDGAIASTAALQAFPNPFNSSSRISFVLSQAEHVKLAVYDLQARQVALLVDAPLAVGRHDLVFDGATLSTGLYFLRMQAGHSASQVTRLLLIR